MTNEKLFPFINSKKTCFNVVFISYPHISYDTKRNHSYIFWREGEIRNREFSFIKSKRHYARLPETFLNNKSSKQQWTAASEKLYATKVPYRQSQE